MERLNSKIYFEKRNAINRKKPIQAVFVKDATCWCRVPALLLFSEKCWYKATQISNGFHVNRYHWQEEPGSIPGHGWHWATSSLPVVPSTPHSSYPAADILCHVDTLGIAMEGKQRRRAGSIRTGQEREFVAEQGISTGSSHWSQTKGHCFQMYIPMPQLIMILRGGKVLKIMIIFMTSVSVQHH